MTRDNVLFTVCGLLTGFIVGYFVASSSHPPVPALAATSSPAAAASADAAPAPSAVELASRVKEIQNAIQRDPENVDLQVQLANTYYDASDWKSAAESYEKTLPKKGSDPNLLTDLGSCYRNLGNFDKALEMYGRAQAAQPSH